MSEEQKSNYKSANYEKRKETQQEVWFTTYGSWLAKSALYGAHCSSMPSRASCWL